MSRHSARFVFELTEEFFFQRFGRQDTAIDFDERSVGTTTRIVDGLSHQIDPGPLFPLQQDASRLFRRLLNLLSQGLHGRAVADHVAEISIAELSFESAILGVQPGSLTGPVQHAGKQSRRIRE